MANTITQIDLPNVRKLKSGKVREIFDLGDSLLFVATDRISAFDVILPNPIPEKGRVLTALSEFWFGKTRHIVENHFVERLRQDRSGGSPRHTCRGPGSAAILRFAVAQRHRTWKRFVAARCWCANASRCRSNASCAATSPDRG
jgi:phosphoribosylaminoimidazole-succinocarboxamide synthase